MQMNTPGQPYSPYADHLPPGGSPAEQIKRAVRKRIFLAILTFAVLSAGAVGLAYLKNKPFYEAEAYVEVRPNRPRILYRTYENETGQSYNAFIETQMNMVRSREIISECVEDATVRQLSCLVREPDQVRALQQALVVKRTGSTQLFSVGLENASSQGLAYTVNLIVDKYIARSKADEARIEQEKKRLLDEEQKKLKADIGTKQDALAKLREELASDNSAPAVTASRDPVSTTLEALITEQTQGSALEARAILLNETLKSEDANIPEMVVEDALNRDSEVARLNAVDAYLRHALVAAQSEATSPSPDLIQQRVNALPEVVTLKGEIGHLELQLTTMPISLSDDNPALKKARASLEAIRKRLEIVEGEATSRITEQVKQNAEQRKQDLEHQLQAVREQVESRRKAARPEIIDRLKKDWRAEIQRQIKETESQLASSKKNEATLSDLHKKYAEQRKLYDRKAGDMKAMEDQIARLDASLRTVEQRIHEIEVESGAPASIRVAAYAIDPKAPGPYLARRVKHGLAGICGAAIGTLFILLMLERRDQRIWSAEDFHPSAGVELLGSLPDGSLLLPANTEAALVCRDAPNSLFAENVRNVTAGVLYPSDGKPAKTVLVTSAAPGDGKTTLAVNLAVCIASLNKRVLLVDANFRKPDVARIFNLGNIPGLGDVLSYGDSPTQTIHQIDGTTLSILTAGTAPAQSGLLGSSRMRDLLGGLTAQHDYVIIDAPPLMLADARVLAPMVDGVVCSLRALSSKRSAVDESIATLRRLGARTIGVTLTGVNPKYDGFGAAMKALSAYTDIKPNNVST